FVNLVAVTFHLFAVRLLLLVQRQPLTALLPILLVLEQPLGLLLVFDRVREVAALGVGRGQRVEVSSLLPIGQLAGAGGRLDGPLAVAVLLVGASGPEPAAVVVRRGVLGVEADRLVEIGDGLVVLPFGVPGVAAAVVRQGDLGVEADRLVEIGDGLVVLPLGVPGEAAVVVRRGVLGVEADRLVEIGDGFVVLPLGVPGEAAAVVRLA